MTIAIKLAALFWLGAAVVRFMCLADRWSDPLTGQDALGQAILWPLFAVKFVAIGLVRAAKELAA